MSSPNKTSTFIRTDYAEEPTQNIRRCRFIAHIADLSALLIGINPSHSLTCHPEHNSLILSDNLVILSEAMDLTPGPGYFVALSHLLAHK